VNQKVKILAGFLVLATLAGSIRFVWRNTRAERHLDAAVSATFRFEADKSAVTAGDLSFQLAAVVDGVSYPITVGPGDIVWEAHGSRGYALALGQGGDAPTVTLKVSQPSEGDAVRLDLEGHGSEETHTLALRVGFPGRAPLFVTSFGSFEDTPTASGPIVVLETSPKAIALVAPRGNLDVAADTQDAHSFTWVSSAEVPIAPNATAAASLTFLAADDSQRIWKPAFLAAGVATHRMRGRVTGTRARASVLGSTATGTPWIRAKASESGSFDFEAPEDVVDWAASVDQTRASRVVTQTPGPNAHIALDVSPGGEIAVKVIDFDSREPLTARLFVRGAPGTPDPSFGPDYRASGAGPLIDAQLGTATTPIPAGRYRVGATHGPEYTVDQREITVEPSRTSAVTLILRRVVPTEGTIACDLHVHARPSFDSPVLPEDRVLSLVSAGIEFAVPTEHNAVGDYGPSVGLLGGGDTLGWVPGVEITTWGPAYGHFGVFPYPVGAKPPPNRGSLKRIIEVARGGDPKRALVVHHPRMPRGIGYFNIVGYRPNQRPPSAMRFDFDAIEVFNGYDAERIDRVEAVLADYYALLNAGHRFATTGSSDSHRIMFHWAGYPRTMVRVSKPEAIASDPSEVVDAIKRGRSFITTGPMIDFSIAGAQPGESAQAADHTEGKLRVWAAPWIDLTNIAIIADGHIVQNIDVSSRPTEWGNDLATPTLRIERTVPLDLAGKHWVMLIARGKRRMDDVLPFMPIVPFGFTNPIWLRSK
jgi:hypothetical protein